MENSTRIGVDFISALAFMRSAAQTLPLLEVILEFTLMPDTFIDHRTKQVIFTRQDSGDFAIQVHREKCVRVGDEAFVKHDRVLNLAASEHVSDAANIGDFGSVTLADLLTVFRDFGEQWDVGGRTRQLILNTPAERLYSVICCRESLTPNQDWQPSRTLSLGLSDIQSQTVSHDGREWTIPVLAAAVRSLCDLWAGD